MFSAGTPCFVLIPSSSKKRVLNPAKVLSCDGATVVVEPESTLDLVEGAEIVAFAEVRNKFMQQGAVVAALSEPATANTLSFKLVGEAVSAESRQTYRVSVAVANLKANICKEADCLVVDISAEGFAAITRAELKIGTNAQVNFGFEGKTVSAAARIQTVKARPDGKFRNGFLIADKVSPARKALSAISAAMQRQQLKRLSAA